MLENRVVNNKDKPVELQWTAPESDKKPHKEQKQKLQKRLKIAISRSNIKIFENEMECDDLSSCGSLIPKISLVSQKLSPTRPILWPISIFRQNRK